MVISFSNSSCVQCTLLHFVSFYSLMQNKWSFFHPYIRLHVDWLRYDGGFNSISSAAIIYNAPHYLLAIFNFHGPFSLSNIEHTEICQFGIFKHFRHSNEYIVDSAYGNPTHFQLHFSVRNKKFRFQSKNSCWASTKASMCWQLVLLTATYWSFFYFQRIPPLVHWINFT